MIEKSPFYPLTKNLNTVNGVIDMHIHTNSSYGGENGKMGITPLQVLGDFANFAKETNQQVTFAVADHNSFKDIIPVYEEINKNKEEYKNVNFITGCEFSVVANSLGQFIKKTNAGFESANICPNFHMLAYNFNPYDENLLYYSSLLDNSSLRFNKDGFDFAYGVLILATRNYFKSKGFNLKLNQFKNFNFDENLSLIKNVESLFSYTLNLKINGDIIENQLNDKQFFSNEYLRYIKKTSNLVKSKYLDVYEVMELVENAGGFCVLAHPGILFENTIEPKKIDLSHSKNKKFKAYSSSKDLIDEFIEKLCNPNIIKQNGQQLKGIVGFEAFHPSNFNRNHLEEIFSYVKKYGLYVTAGSDTHYQLTPNRIAGAVMSGHIERYTKKINNLPISLIYNYMITKLQIVEDIKNNKIIERNPNNNIDNNVMECNAILNEKVNFDNLINLIKKIEVLKAAAIQNKKLSKNNNKNNNFSL